MLKRTTKLFLIFTALLAMAGLVIAQSGGGYDLSRTTVDGGGGQSTGGQFSLGGTIGQADAGLMSGGNYTLNGGFWDRAAVIHNVGLNGGWNMISSFVAPSPAAMAGIFPPAGGDFILCKDGGGQIFWPAMGIDQIVNWHPAEGYQCYANAGFGISLAGPRIPAGSAMELPAGWGIIAYWRDVPLAAETALAACNPQLVLAKDVHGQVFWPAYNINQIDDMQPGQGYQVFLDAVCTLTFPEN